MSITNGSSTATASRTSTVATFGCLLFFGLIWTVCVLGFDGVTLWGAIRQIRATGFPKTSGLVTKSSFQSHHDTIPDANGAASESVTYSPAIEYSYSVAGKQYRGRRYRFGGVSGGQRNARQIIGAFPVGKNVDVFYSPGDPAMAVLKTGLEGTDLFMAMFLLPFNMVMLGIWYAIAQGFGRNRPSLAGGCKVTDDGYTTRVRLSYVTPVKCGLVAIGFWSFFGIFAGGISQGLNPALKTMYFAWGFVLAIGVLAALVWTIKLARGDRDLVIDEMSQTVHLPQMFGRPEPLSIPGKQVRAIDVEQVLKRGSKGGPYYTYSPTLVYEEGGEQRRTKLCDISTECYAESLAELLRERLRLKAAENSQMPDG